MVLYVWWWWCCRWGCWCQCICWCVVRVVGHVGVLCYGASLNGGEVGGSGRVGIGVDGGVSVVVVDAIFTMSCDVVVVGGVYYVGGDDDDDGGIGYVGCVDVVLCW